MVCPSLRELRGEGATVTAIVPQPLKPVLERLPCTASCRPSPAGRKPAARHEQSSPSAPAFPDAERTQTTKPGCVPVLILGTNLVRALPHGALAAPMLPHRSSELPASQQA